MLLLISAAAVGGYLLLRQLREWGLRRIGHGKTVLEFDAPGNRGDQKHYHLITGRLTQPAPKPGERSYYEAWLDGLLDSWRSDENSNPDHPLVLDFCELDYANNSFHSDLSRWIIKIIRNNHAQVKAFFPAGVETPGKHKLRSLFRACEIAFSHASSEKVQRMLAEGKDLAAWLDAQRSVSIHIIQTREHTPENFVRGTIERLSSPELAAQYFPELYAKRPTKRN